MAASRAVKGALVKVLKAERLMRDAGGGCARNGALPVRVSRHRETSAAGQLGLIAPAPPR
jgi:hypothetical protein